MKKISRRSFMKSSVLAGAAAAMAGATAVTASAATPAPAAEEEEHCLSELFNPTPRMVLQFDEPVVQTQSGSVRGFIQNGVYTFRGIPYATAGRYEEPAKVAAWSGIRTCCVYGGQCPQAASSLSDAEILNPHVFWLSDENCQTLNIWSKNVGSSTKKPVMFWIHGGGFSSGSAIEMPCHDGHNLCDTGDVVVVSINHRLNCLGFLDLSAYGAQYAHSGNLGIMDIVAALEWVRDNIAQFGGDPGNVTLFGQSGGGRKILTLMQTPSAKGLFHKVICESCGISGVPQADAQVVARHTFAQLGLAEGDVEGLKKTPYDQLLAAATAAQNLATEELGHSVGWYPVFDGDFLPANVWRGGAGSNSPEIPMIIGNVFAEVTTNAFSIVMAGDSSKNSWDAATVDKKLSDMYGDRKDAVVAAFQKAYPNKPIVDALYVTLNGYRAEELEVLKVRGASYAAGGAPTYNYIFTYEFPTFGGILPWHCSEVPFVFGNVELHAQGNGATDEGLALSRKMVKAWTTFARTGNPNYFGMTEWPAYTAEEGACIMLEPDMYVGYHHDSALFEAALG